MKIEKLYTSIVKPELIANNRRKSTISCLERSVCRFKQYEKSLGKKIKIKKIKRKTLLEFRNFLAKDCKIPTQNSTIQGICQLLKIAYKNELIKTIPILEPLKNNHKEYKIFPSDDDISLLWDNCKYLNWPKKDSLGNTLSYSPEYGWKFLLMFLRTFGFRIQEIVSFGHDFNSINWSNINYQKETPNPEGGISSEFGWLVYVPQKQKRVKPDPLYLPLPNHIKSALNILDNKKDRSISVLDWPMSRITFIKKWKHLMDISGVKPKQSSGLEYYLPKHFRKGATTSINNYMPNMAQYIIGHSADRTGQNSVVSDKHYYNAEQAIYKCVHNMPYPKCFSEFT